MTTNSASSTVDGTAPAVPADPRSAFTAAADLACRLAAAVRPEQLPGPTPCPEYDVRALLGHLVSVFRRVAAVGRGDAPFSVPQVTTGVPDAGWGAATRAAADEVAAVWADPTILDRPLTLPFGTLPGSAALAVYTGEVSTHSWDLAVATGQDPAWDPAVLQLALSASRRALPAEGRGPAIPFAAAVPVPDDAPPLHRLVAWQGRDPRWNPEG